MKLSELERMAMTAPAKPLPCPPIWGAMEHHARRHLLVVFSPECSEGDDYGDPFMEIPHSRWPQGKREHIARLSEFNTSKRIPRCKRCIAAWNRRAPQEGR